MTGITSETVYDPSTGPVIPSDAFEEVLSFVPITQIFKLRKASHRVDFLFKHALSILFSSKYVELRSRVYEWYRQQREAPSDAITLVERYYFHGTPFAPGGNNFIDFTVVNLLIQALGYLDIKNFILNNVWQNVTVYNSSLHFNDAFTLPLSNTLLITDKIFIRALIQHTGVLQLADEILRKDRDVVLAAVAKNGLALQFADSALKANRDVVLAAVTQNGHALQFAGPALKTDRDVVLAAVTQTEYAFQFADRALKADPEFILAAITQNGMALQFVGPKWQADPKIVLAAVAKNGLALQFADLTLQADREIVRTAVTQNRQALQWAEPALIVRIRSQNGWYV